MYFIGIDWADEKHHICVLDPQGKVIREFDISHDQRGFDILRKRIARLDDAIKIILSVRTVCWCFFMAALAEKVGLAAIVGAVAAGLVLDQTHYRGYKSMEAKHVEELLAPLSAVYVPVFFVLMGLRVDLLAFSSLSVLQFAAVLSIAAIIGKQICSLGILEKGLNRLAVGVGMIPRGEVGLIFLSVGRGLGVISQPLFAALLVAVIVTTLITPPALNWSLGRRADVRSGR